MDDIKALVETTLKTKILEAFNEGPELLEKLIDSALKDHQVDDYGHKPRFGNGKPYLDFIVGDQIRNAAVTATREVINEHMDAFKQQIAKRLREGEFAEAAAEAIIESLSEDWKVSVKFERKNPES